MYIHVHIYLHIVFCYDVTDIIDCVLNTNRGVLTLVGEIRRYRNDRYYYYYNKLPFCLVSLPPPPPSLFLSLSPWSDLKC